MSGGQRCSLGFSSRAQSRNGTRVEREATFEHLAFSPLQQAQSITLASSFVRYILLVLLVAALFDIVTFSSQAKMICTKAMILADARHGGSERISARSAMAVLSASLSSCKF